METDKSAKSMPEKRYSAMEVASMIEPQEDTDPQEKMEGPVSTLAKKLSRVMETDQNKEDATKEHDERM